MALQTLVCCCLQLLQCVPQWNPHVCWLSLRFDCHLMDWRIVLVDCPVLAVIPCPSCPKCVPTVRSLGVKICKWQFSACWPTISDLRYSSIINNVARRWIFLVFWTLCRSESLTLSLTLPKIGFPMIFSRSALLFVTNDLLCPCLSLTLPSTCLIALWLVAIT